MYAALAVFAWIGKKKEDRPGSGANVVVNDT